MGYDGEDSLEEEATGLSKGLTRVNKGSGLNRNK